MKKLSAQQYFNMHAHDHSYNRHLESYKPLIGFIHKCQQKAARPITILDMGYGTGIFIQKVLEINLREDKHTFVTIFEDKRFSKDYDLRTKQLKV